jgi:NarL family two-component system sensor histidine kinase LiaS
VRRFTRSFRRLRGKLTLSYTLTSVAAFLLVETLLFGIALGWRSTNSSVFVVSDLQQQASQVASLFTSGTPDREALATLLNRVNTNLTNTGPFFYHPIFLAVVDTQGQIIASNGTQPLPTGGSIRDWFSQQDRANLDRVLGDSKGNTSLASSDADGTLVAAAPITNARHVRGALAMKIAQPDFFTVLAIFLQDILFSTLVITIFAAIVGMVFGNLTARGLTRRLKRLSAAADRWSSGDFSALTVDRSQDELGQLAQQLNHMAEQLQNLLQTRQQFAALEERNRLARDLHDSVKQQVFAVSMQIAATRILLKRDVDAAGERLNKAEKLVQQAQQELTSLIRELRPVALEGKGLVTALRELIPQWSQQAEIVANLRVEGTQALPLTVEEALFRVAQEALSNVARHSRATLVQITLTITDEMVSLAVLDNGQGFDPARLEHQGIGLHSMQERMKMLGGGLILESTPDHDTLVTAYCTRLGIGTGETTTEPAGEDTPNTGSRKVAP